MRRGWWWTGSGRSESLQCSECMQCLQCCYTRIMVAITIRNVPEEVRNELAARAAKRGQSLQEYLLRELGAIASREPLDDWLTRVRVRATEGGSDGVTVGSILQALDEARR